MAKRDIGQESLDGIRAIKRGEGKRYEIEEPAVKAIREHVGLSQSAVAAGAPPPSTGRTPTAGST